MGASNFRTIAYGKTAQECFTNAKADAQYESGHDGYSGTIAEKPGFTMLTPPPELNQEELEDWVSDKEDENEKGGNAYCIKLGLMTAGTFKGQNKFLFFGWASS